MSNGGTAGGTGALDRTVEASLAALIDSHRPGLTLPQGFYVQGPVFREDRRRVFESLWHLAGHASAIPGTGDYFLFRICDEEIIIVRDRDGKVHAHHNVCRHRGSRVVTASSGRLNTLVCPYHAWSYRLDGTLRHAQLMGSDFRPEEHGLHPCRVREFHGLIFVALADEPTPFDHAFAPFHEYLAFHGIGTAKIARTLTLPTRANWKLVVENFIECYHCATAHPQYRSVHSRTKLLAAGAGMHSGPEAAARAYESTLDTWKRKTERLGHPVLEKRLADGAAMSRMPIKDGWLTESRDGRPVAPLMGKCRAYDGGITYLAFNYTNWLIASNDHALVLRFTPRSNLSTDVAAIWLVDGQAVAGRDYDPDDIAWVWDATLRQDATITEGNQAGVLSTRYRPGPYSEQERVNKRFTQWYLDRLAAPV